MTVGFVGLGIPAAYYTFRLYFRVFQGPLERAQVRKVGLVEESIR